jgi:hypothetical protein
MALSIVAMGCFFFVASMYQLYYLHDRLQHAPADVRPVFAEFEKSAPEVTGRNLEYLRWKTLVLLEQDVINKRYTQTNSVMIVRMWTRYLGFVTGMILALSGAVFVLGKLREDTTRVEARMEAVSGSLATSSPGLVLVTFGTLLMIVSVWIKSDIETIDSPVYVAPATVLPAPQMLDLQGPPVTEGKTRRNDGKDGVPK